MTTLLLLKDLYVNSFSDLSSKPVANFLKVMSWFCFACLLVVLYAFAYRIFTGFTF